MSGFSHTIVAVAVWGEFHRRKFLDTFMPSLRAALPKDAQRLRPVMVVYTTAEDWEAIKGEIGMTELEVMLIQPTDHAGNTMVQCQKHALGLAHARNAALSYLFPDMWLMPRSFEWVADVVEAGARACMFTTCSVIDTAAAEILARRPPMVMPWEKDAVAWELTQHIAQNSLARTWDDDGRLTGSTRHPGMLYRLPTPDLPLLVMNAFHQNPVWVYPRRLATNFGTSMDGDFIDYAGLRVSEIAVLREGFWFVELAAKSKVDSMDEAGGGLMPAPMTEAQMREWVERSTTPINRHMGCHSIVLARRPGWSDPEAEAALLARLSRNAGRFAWPE